MDNDRLHIIGDITWYEFLNCVVRMDEAQSIKKLLFWQKSPQVRDKSKTRGRKQDVPNVIHSVSECLDNKDHPPHTQNYVLFLRKT